MLSDLVRGDDGAVALVRANGASTTYGALRKAASRGAALLASRGAGQGKTIGIAVADPASFVIAALAAWQTGAAVVPLDARAGDAWTAKAAPRARVVAIVDDATGDGDLDVRAADGGDVDARAALVLFTSGSSAEPKAVLLSRDGIDANVRAIVDYLPIAAYPRTAVVVPLSYSYGLVGQVLTTLFVGGAIVLLGDVVYPALQVEAMARLDARGLSTVPTSLRLLARAASESPIAERPPLGYVASAGAPLDAATVATVRDAFPTARMFNQYGLTEASPRVTAVDDRAPAFAAGSVGRAIGGVEVWAASPEGERLASGVEGEIMVRGPSVMLEYLGDPDGTARVLSADGALRSGDAGYVDADGYVFVRGRLDGVVKCAGERVSVEEVAAVLRTAPGVREACVVAVAHADLGNTLHAFVEADAASLPAIRRFARETLPPAKRPSRFMAVDALPRTANGKIARGDLPTVGR